MATKNPYAFKSRSRFADRGAVAEKATQKFLELWEASDSHREYNRLVDAKAAGRVIKAAVADFEWFCSAAHDYHGLIEVKETKHDYRLDKSRITQLARLRRRARAGGLCCVLVYHSTIDKWRVLGVDYMASDPTGGSWNMKDLPLYEGPGDALCATFPGAFPL